MTDLIERTGSEIAIVGVAGRFPGARTLHEFWTNLRGGVESIRRLSDDALAAEGVPDVLLRDPAYVKAAAILDDLEWWDARFWGFSPRDAAIMDPQHRLFLECAYEALETAGHAPDRFPGPIGVYAGVGMGAYFQHHILANAQLVEDVGLFLLRHTGNDKDFLSTRVSYELDLKGPSVNIQTACSTSLVAMHMASQALLNGEVDLALAGGVTIELPHRVGYRYRANEILAPDGHCRAFDAQAQGTVFGSGAGVVVLRRLQDALDDGDHIFAVIRGSAINNDGSGKVGFLAPSVDGQAAAIAEALAMADVTAESIDYVEAHGTGTAVGDPIEVAALTQAFRRTTTASGYCGLGSVKTNIGHLDTAAGVAGVIKVLLAFAHEEIPATLHFTAPNPLIDFSKTPFFVTGQSRRWTRGARPRRAGVSSLGVGGTNAHVVLEEAPLRAVADTSAPSWEIVPLSARTETALGQMAANLADELREHPTHRLRDVAWTLQSGRLAHAHRRVVIARSVSDAASALEQSDAPLQSMAEAPSGARRVTMCFAGGGAQHPGMARTLYDSEPLFRAVIDEGLASVDPAHRDAVRRALFAAPTDALAIRELERPSVGLPALLLTQVAMARLWMHWGITPGALIGHSMGEYSAAHLAGVFSLADAVRLVTVRGRLFEGVPEGAMLSVGMSPADLVPHLGAPLSIAAVNGESLCVVSGPLHEIDALEATLTARDTECRRVRINVAAHSSMLEPILAEFDAFLRTVKMSTPQLPLVSNLTGTWMRDVDAVDPTYWVRHLRETVRFADGLQSLMQDPDRVFLEVGPGRTLTGLARLHPARRDGHAVFTSLPHVEDTADIDAYVRGTLGSLWCHGVAVDWAALRGDRTARRVPLPTYPWERQRYWIERGVSTQPPMAAGAVGTRASDPTEWFLAPVWRRTDHVPTSGAPSLAWLLASADDDVAVGLARRWEDAGTRVVRIRDGASFARLGVDEYQVRGGEPTDWSQLWKAAVAEGAIPRHIVHGWPLTADDAHLESAAFHTLAALGNGLALEDPTSPITLTVLTRGALDVVGDDTLHPLAAMALGPVHVLPAELPVLDARLIDLEAGPQSDARQDDVIRMLSDEIPAPVEAPVAAYRGGRRWTRTFEGVDSRVAAAPARTLRPGGTYLITGGLGGLGLQIAEWMASTAQARLVLVSRRTLPPRESWSSPSPASDVATLASVSAVQKLEAMGATVLTCAADVTDTQALQAAIRAAETTFGALHGVVHAAGVSSDALLVHKSHADMRAVIAPKVQGTLALESALGDRALDFLVCFSSVSAMAGLPGQIDYAAANAFLDSWCAQQSTRRHRPTLSLAWSAWRDVGMVAAPRSRRGEVAAHPLLGRALRGGDDALYATVLDGGQHWIMAEHRLADGPSLVPGTGYLEIARAALAPWAERSGGALELRDVAFLSPLVLHGGAPREMRVAVHENGMAARFVIVGATPPGEDGVPWQEHVLGEAVCVPSSTPEPVNLDRVIARCVGRDGSTDARVRDPHLDFGPRWDNVRRVHLGADEALLELALPDAFARDLPEYALHPALMDMATAGAQVLIPGYDRVRDFFVPLSYSRIAIFAPLESTICSVIRLRPPSGDESDLAVFDVTITDSAGRVLVEIEEFLMTRVTDREQLLASTTRRRRSALDVETEVAEDPVVELPSWYVDAIRPEEGVKAMERAIGLASGHSHVLVSPFPLESLLGRLREGAGPKAPARAESTPLPRVPVLEIEHALAAHDAVSDAVVMQRADRTGSVRLVAYVGLSSQGRATVSELRRFLKRQLAAHLVPSTYVMVDEWPRRADGSIQREALADPFGAADDFVAPRSPTEKVVGEIWSDILGIERISVYDNFFDVGGHSLLAVRVISRLDKRIGVRLNQAIMVLQTLEQIASECDKRVAASSPATRPGRA